MERQVVTKQQGLLGCHCARTFSVWCQIPQTWMIQGHSFYRLKNNKLQTGLFSSLVFWSCKLNRKKGGSFSQSEMHFFKPSAETRQLRRALIPHRLILCSGFVRFLSFSWKWAACSRRRISSILTSFFLNNKTKGFSHFMYSLMAMFPWQQCPTEYSREGRENRMSGRERREREFFSWVHQGVSSVCPSLILKQS